MDAFNAQNVPCLALVLGDEASLTSLHLRLTAFPHGVNYAQFRHILLSYLYPASASAAMEQEAASPMLTSPPLSANAAHRLSSSPTLSRADDAPFALSTSASPSPALFIDRAQENQDSNREEARMQRVRTRQELAGLSAAPVDPIKQLFNRIDVTNEQCVTWDKLLDYVVAEAGAGLAEARYNANRTNIYSFSRALRCPVKQHHRSVTPPPPPPESQGSTAKATATFTYQRFQRDLQETQTSNTRVTTGSNSSSSSGTNVVRTEQDLSILRLLDGLESHSAVFFVSSRSRPFLLYSKESLGRVFTAPPDMLGGAVPTAVSYLAEHDLFLCYSTDDRLLRGWYFLLAQSIATVAVSPLVVEGFVRRMRTMPTSSPTYADFADSVFLGDSYGHVLRVTAPRGRGVGMEFVVERTYRNLHSRDSGGLVDFCVYGTYLYSSGFDGRVVATSLVTGQSSEVGSVDHEHLHALVYIPPYEGLVAATSNSRQLLWWEAGSQSALPGVPFEHAGYGDHAAAIVAVVYVAESDYLASADCDGVVKVWEMVTHRCVQSFQGSRMTSGDGGGGGGSEEATPSTTLKSQGRAKGDSATVTGDFPASAGRDMMMLTHNGLHSLLSESAGVGHVGSAQCHSLSYCAETEELFCGFANAVVCWGLSGNKHPYMCDAEEVCQDAMYDVRHQTFLLRSATRLSVWDSVHGVRRGLLDFTKLRSVSHAMAEIKCVCLDDLGSRVFLAAADGNVYAYPTQALTANAAGEMDETLYLWYAASDVKGSDDAALPPAPVLVEQMHFSSTLRTWMAITSCGTLLVRTETDSQQTVSATSINVSAFALCHMRVSEELGLVAVVDAQHTLYLYDMEAWADAPEMRSLASYGRVVDLTFLDAAPVLVTVHEGGMCRCWSCPPAVECFELLAIIRHPKLPAPAEPLETREMADGVLHTAAALAASVKCGATSSVATGDRAMTMKMTVTGVAARPANTTLSCTASWRPLTASLRNCPPSSGKDAPRALVGKPAGSERVKNESSELGQSRGSRLPASSAFHQAPKDIVAGRADTRGSWSMSPESLIMNPAARAKALSSEATTFTSIAYDGQRHHLFLGDAQGVVHVYRMCALLQLYKLPRCSYAARPALSLFSRERAHLLSLEAEGETSDSDNERAWASRAPVLLRSVEVHVRHRDRSVSRKRSLSLAASLHHLPLQPQPKAREHDAGGVVCVRWLASRDVLLTSGYDHEVWLLNADGDTLGFLSAERMPPKAKNLLNATANTVTSPPLPSKVFGIDSLAASLLSAKPGGLKDASPLQRLFYLPPAQLIAEQTDTTTSTAQLTNLPECCTHARLVDEAVPAARFWKTVTLEDGSEGEMSAHRAPASRRRTTMHMPSLPLESSLAEFAHPPRSAPALLDYLAATNSDTSAVQANRETRQTSLGEGNASTTVLSSSPRTSSSYAAVCVSAKSPPLPLPPVPQKRVMALSKAVRFNRVGHVVQAAAAAKEEDEEEDDESARASICGEAGSLAVYGDQTSVTSVTAAAATANSALVEPNLGSRRASLSACMQDTTRHEALCSDTSNHTGTLTSPSTATPFTADRLAPQSVERDSFLHSSRSSLCCSAVPALSTDKEASADELGLWVTGLSLRHPAKQPRLPEIMRYFSAARPSPRRGPPAPTFPPRPRTTGGVSGCYGRAVLRSEDRLMPSLRAPYTAKTVAQAQRVATVFSAQAKVSPMLAYASATEGDETLELYSRELRQRLRRPRHSNS